MLTPFYRQWITESQKNEMAAQGRFEMLIQIAWLRGHWALKLQMFLLPCQTRDSYHLKEMLGSWGFFFFVIIVVFIGKMVL